VSVTYFCLYMSVHANYEFYYSDVTVTSSKAIKYDDVGVEVVT